ncbi:hypothetical protein GYMLUDRAFT_94700 [Collybiopsis luxurians FD-317 M1]|nr:hypothetical protein GYMLUDRAFT_94700 [Collybiopsis luxurians FD-317 M1]
MLMFSEASTSFKFTFKPRIDAIYTRYRSSSISPRNIQELLHHCDCDISDFNVEIARLQLKKRQLAEYKLYLKSLISLDYVPPIQRLPNELLLHIFELACLNNLFRFRKTAQCKLYSNSLFMPPPPALAISAVCSRWRKLSLGVSSLWSGMKLEIFKPDPLQSHLCNGFMAILQLYLDRSADAPLCLDVDIQAVSESDPSRPYVPPALILLLKHSKRWRSFKLNWDYELQLSKITNPSQVSFPILEEISMTNANFEIPRRDLDVFACAPSLRFVRTADLIPKSRLPWNQLTCLDIFIPDATDVFEHCPHLLSLTLRSPGGWSCHDELTVPLADLRSLSLVIGDDPEGFLDCIFASFTVPSLTELIIRADENEDENEDEDGHEDEQVELDEQEMPLWPSKTFETFLSRSSCNLITFSLQGVIISDLELITALQKLPSLLNLNLDDSHMTPSPITPHLISSLDTTQAVLDGSQKASSPIPESPRLLPKLRHLAFNVQGSSFNDTLFVNMVLSRWIFDPSKKADVTTETALGCLSVDLRFQARKVDQIIYAPLFLLGRAVSVINEMKQEDRDFKREVSRGTRR